MKRLFLGFDPGLSGGVAALSDTGEVILAERMPRVRGSRRCVGPRRHRPRAARPCRGK
jgi:hypothetical protein